MPRCGDPRRCLASLEPVIRQDPLDGLLARGRRKGSEDHDGDPDKNEAGRDDDQKNATHFVRHGPRCDSGGSLASASGRVLPSGDMTRNTAMKETVPLPDALAGRSIVMVGLMGAGKTSIGRRLAGRLGMPFRDADAEIELAAGCTISELFAHYGEPAFRDGERRVIRRLLAGNPMVLALGGGAFMDPATRATARDEAVSVWLRCKLPTLVRRVTGRDHRPLLAQGDPAEILGRLMQIRHPVYAEADIVVDCGDESPEATTSRVLGSVLGWRAPRRVSVSLERNSYDVVVGEGLLARAGALLAPILPQKRAVVVTDAAVAPLHLPTLLNGLTETAVDVHHVIVPSGETSKSLETYARVVDSLLEAGVERRTTVIALGGGVVGDLAGLAAATTLRGLPFVQVPTTLLAQVDSSVGGKTGINTAFGKNLLGAFHQPRMVLADIATLKTLPPRELRAGYAEIAKTGLIGDADFFEWCEQNGAAVIGGEGEMQGEAVMRACSFKAEVVGDDEREERPNDGRALLNLGHTFAHALEAEYAYGGGLLHGEAVAVGLGLAFLLSARLRHCAYADAERVIAHMRAMQLPARIRHLDRRFSATTLSGHMRRDKKVRDGVLRFVLARGIGQAFTANDVPAEVVTDLLRDEGCDA
jgi:shikimate kinase / 3-dehydroquinate synthase